MIYSLILLNREIIADFSEIEGDFLSFSMKVLKTLNKNNEFTFLENESYYFNILIFEEFIFLTITNLNSNIEQVLEFLKTLKFRFLEIFKIEKENLTIVSTNLLKELMNLYIKNLEYEKIDKVEHELDEVKVEIKRNLEKTIEKDYQIENLLIKSKNLMRDV